MNYTGARMRLDISRAGIQARASEISAKIQPMPDDNGSSNPYKPQQPRIPGVPSGGPGGGGGGSRAAEMVPRLVLRVGIAAIVVAVVVTAMKFSHSSKPAAEPAATSAPAAEPAAKPAAEPEKPAEKILVGPGPVATKQEVEKNWAAKRFDFRDPTSGTIEQAMVVHLPGNAYWGFSLREPYGTCGLLYLTDENTIQAQYGYTTDHPLVADPCTKTLYDLEKYWNGPDGLVRGQMVQGSGVRPPMAIEMKVKGDEIWAVRSE